MATLIDTNLTLVYKNMVGLTNIVTDISGNSYLNASLSVNSNFYVSSSSLLIGSTTINSYLNVSGNTILNSSLSLSSSLNVSGNTSINGPVSIYNNLNVTGNTTINNNLVVSGISILNGPTTYNSQLYVSGLANILNGIKVDNINSNILNINASTINIGNYNSKININGTATSIVSSELLIVDKLISINVNSSTLQGVDIGMLSGIQIMGISSSGFIRTSADASRYQIQSPLLNASTNYITVQDLNNNFIISGTSTLIGSSTINSLFNSGGLIINGQTTINNSLNISGSAIINNSSTLNNTLTISGYTNIDGGCSINSFLNISGLTNINNFASINSYLNISGLTNINGSVSVNSSLNVSGLTIINNSTSINSSLNISGSLIINPPISINSSLNVSSSTNIIGNTTINSNMMISNKSIFNNYTTMNSSLNVSGSSIFNNGIAIQSTLGISGQIVAALPHYLYNIDAINGGVPLWGFYRSGAMIKIRIDDPTAPPRIFFSSGSSISINQGSSFIDPGAYALDSYNNTNLVYLTSIISITNPTNLLSSNILISGSTTIVSANSSLTTGSYTVTYQATDLNGNIGYNYRSLIYKSTISAYGFRDFTDTSLTLNSPTGFQMDYFNLNIFPQLKQSIVFTIEFWLYTMGPYGVWPYKSSYSPTDIRYVGPDSQLTIPTTTKAFGHNGGAGLVAIVSLWDVTSNQNINIYREPYFKANTYISFQWENNTSTFISTNFDSLNDTTSYQYNNWEHYVIQYDGTNFKVFIDGHQLLLSNIAVPLNTKLGRSASTVPFKDHLLIGAGWYNFYPGYISQLKISNCIRYTGTDFISPRNIYNVDSNTIFLLGDNGTDVISNTGNFSNPYTITRNLVDINSSYLVYQFPGGRLTNNYWSCHNNTIGASWSNMMNFSSVYNPNQNFSNGMSIAVNLYINSTDVGIFYYGSDPSNLSNSLYIKYTTGDFSVTCNGVTSSIGVVNNTNTSGHNLINSDGYNNYNFLVKKSRMLFIFYPNGYMHLWIDQYRFTPALGINVGFNNNFNKTGLWLGALGGSNFTGVISNLRIYNKPMNWDQVYAI